MCLGYDVVLCGRIVHRLFLCYVLAKYINVRAVSFSLRDVFAIAAAIVVNVSAYCVNLSI